MLRRLGSFWMQRLAVAQQPARLSGLPGAAAAPAWPADVQTLSALAAAASGHTAQLHTDQTLCQQHFTSLNNLSDNPGATKSVSAASQVSVWACT